MTQTLSVGRIVHYTLTEFDADEINRRRADAQREGAGNTGKIVHVGNSAAAGEVCAAIVVKAFTGDRANLQVMLDGNDALWRTSVPWALSSAGRGNWSWPPRV